MILADALSISINLLLVAHVVISLLLILVVLMQRPKQEGLGAAFGGGMTDQMFGAQTTNVLQKGTVYLGTLFVVLSLVLAILIGHQNNEKAITATAAEPVEEAPAIPDAAPGGGSIKEELENEGEAETPGTGGAGGEESSGPEGATPPADTDATPPADTDATPPADTDATPPADTDATPPADTDATPPADIDAAPEPDAGSSTPSEPEGAGDDTAPPPVGDGGEDKPE